MRVLLLCFALVIAGDLLFYNMPDPRTPGLTVAVYCFLCLFIILFRKSSLLTKKPWISAIIALICILPLFEDLNLFSFTFAICGLATLSISSKYGTAGSFYETAQRLFLFVLTIPWKIFHDLSIFRRILIFRTRFFSVKTFLSWFLPLSFAGFFMFLFVLANPILESWLSHIKNWLSTSNPDISFLSTPRIALWLILTILTWPFLRPALLKFSGNTSDSQKQNPGSGETSSYISPALLSQDIILRSLIMCNLLFAVQSGLDMTYLWGGATLPKELTYSAYAQKGIFPLILAALLAAGFILLSANSLENKERRAKILTLMFLWISQMILLTISCILRLYLYISAYSLTHSRLIGLVLIGLITLGLVWIIIRLVLQKPNLWLVKVNAMTVIVVLYAFCFIDTNYHIAQFNVTHAREVGGEGVHLDIRYLSELGPSALPALKWYYQRIYKATPNDNEKFVFTRLENIKSEHMKTLDDRLSNWRGYTLRNYRLVYIHKALEPLILKPNEGKGINTIQGNTTSQP